MNTEPTVTEMYRELLDMFNPNWIIGLSDTEIKNLWHQEIGYYK